MAKLWEGRFKSTLVDSDSYLFTLMRYIELHPVRAEMVEHLLNCPWSSYHHNSDGKECLQPHRLYNQLGKNKNVRTKAYRALFEGHLPDDIIEEIRAATDISWALGDERFKHQIQQSTDWRIDPENRGGYRLKHGDFN
jgi:putative transposase